MNIASLIHATKPGGASVAKAQRFQLRDMPPSAEARASCSCGRGPLSVEMFDRESKRWYRMCRECAAAGLQE